MRQTPIAILLAIFLFTAAAHAAEPGPADVVKAFNGAITARNLDAALTYFAKGSVHYTLRSAHGGIAPGEGGITSDLKDHWSMIGPVVISSTTVYQRIPEILATRVDGELATVWAMISSRTVDHAGKEQKGKFSEVYLLVRTAAGWQIGAIADNRGATAFAGAPAGAK
ncbi:MAG: hypothetical protein Q8N51_12530 [Gammaproteobacteria bacterium]|nr:hypothetical protein [Gammaproteobacteria bacterium]